MNTQTLTAAQKLEQQIQELTEKHNLQVSVEDKLPGIKMYTNPFNYRAKGTKYVIHAKLEDTPLHEIKAKIMQVLEAFKPTQNNLLSFAGKDEQPTANPFVLRFKNNIRSHEAQIDYISGEYWVNIDLPISYYSDDCKGVFMRKVYDSEHHYFGGYSMKEINNMQIRSYKLDMFETVKYYGGDTAHYITDEEDKEEYESVVLFGHIPQFVDGWQNSFNNQ